MDWQEYRNWASAYSPFIYFAHTPNIYLVHKDYDQHQKSREWFQPCGSLMWSEHETASITETEHTAGKGESALFRRKALKTSSKEMHNCPILLDTFINYLFWQDLLYPKLASNSLCSWKMVLNFPFFCSHPQPPRAGIPSGPQSVALHFFKRQKFTQHATHILLARVALKFHHITKTNQKELIHCMYQTLKAFMVLILAS